MVLPAVRAPSHRPTVIHYLTKTMELNTDYPGNWDTRRKNVYERDDYTCCNCGRQGGPYGDLELNAHHIVPKSRGGTHEYSNLITACSECHAAIHSTHRVAPTAYPRETTSWSARNGRWWVHLLLLVTTFGVGNVIYWILCRFL